MPDVVAQPAKASVSEATRTTRLIGCAISDHVDSPRDAEYELLIGYPTILLHIRKGQRGFAAEVVQRGQRAHLEGGRVYRDHQIPVIRLRFARSKLQRHRTWNGAIGCRGRKIAGDVALAGEEQGRGAGLIP